MLQPGECKEDRALLREAVAKDCTLYMRLPDVLKSDSVLAVAAVIHCDYVGVDVIFPEALARAPSAFQGEQTTLDDGDYSRDVFRYFHESLRNDQELVIQLLDEAVYDELSEQLRRGPQVIACALDHGLLHQVPQESLTSHPELAIRAISHDNFGPESDYGAMPHHLFRRLDVSLAFAESRGCMHFDFPKDHCGNRQLCLSFLSSVEDESPDQVLDWISDEFFRDKSFILEGLKAIKGSWASGYDLRRCQPHLIDDYEVRLAAFGVDENFTLFVEGCTDNGLEDTIPVFAREVKERLQNRDSFILFLFGIGLAEQHRTPPAFRSKLPMLNKDPDTMKGLGKIIKSYVGIPVGEELELLRRAWAYEDLRRYAGDIQEEQVSDEDSTE